MIDHECGFGVGAGGEIPKQKNDQINEND
jgi:hypothetical protein